MRVSKQMFLAVAAASALVQPAALRAQGRTTYGDTLAARERALHPELQAVVLHPGETAPAAPAVSTLRRPLLDSAGGALGTVDVVFAAGAAPSAATADAVARDLSRHIYVVANITDPSPFMGDPPQGTCAQALVDEAVAREPDLITLAMHIAPSPGAANIILASNFGRLGKPADKDDVAVEQDGKVIQEVTSGGSRLAVELPLKDGAGASIGALSTSFRLPSAADTPAIRRKAEAFRDGLAMQIPSKAALVRPGGCAALR